MTVKDPKLWYLKPQTYLVILKILNSRKALKTLIPKDIPGLKNPQTTSKMLPTITCAKRQED